MYSDMASPIASSSSHNLMQYPTNQDQYYHSEQEPTPTSASSWFSDWQWQSYNADLDPEKTPTMTPIEPSPQIFHFQGMQGLDQALYSSPTVDLAFDLNSAFDLHRTPLDLNQAFNPNPAFVQNIPMNMNQYNEYNIYHEPRPTPQFPSQVIGYPTSPQFTPHFNSIAATSSAHAMIHPFPTYNDSEKFIPRIFHPDRLAAERNSPRPKAKPFTHVVRLEDPIDIRVPLDRLPKEVHVRICDYLDLHEIIKWGTLRKSLWIHNLRDRNIWHRLLRRLTPSDSIPVSFYPIRRTDTDGYAVRWMTEWPSKWLYTLKTRPDGGHVYDKRTFDCRQQDRTQGLPNESYNKGLAILLVPSGRYLVASDGKQLFFWDMQMGCRQAFQFGCSIAHDHPRSGAYSTKPTLAAYAAPNGDMRVIVFFNRSKDKIGRYSIYDIHPGDEDSPCAIRHLENTSQNDKLYTCKGDLFATLAGNILSIRNLVSKSTESLTISNDAPPQLVTFSSPSYIVVISMRGFSVYKLLPDLLDSSKYIDIAPSAPEPIFSMNVDFKERTNNDIGSMGSYSPPIFDKPPLWHEESDAHPVIFDLVRTRKGKKPDQLRWRYELRLPDLDNLNAPGISNAEERNTCKLITRFQVHNQWTQLRNYGFSNNQIILAGPSHGKGVGITYAPGSSISQNGKAAPKKGCYSSFLFGTEQPDMPTSTEFELCPVTGRVCYTTSTPYEIAVIDYFDLGT